jgi:ligand-binding SRPBCC domain-containing protein
MTHVLERTQTVHGEVASVFEFFTNPHNLEALTPPWLHFGVVDASEARVRLGTRIAYRLRWQIFPVRWESLIAEFRENELFADEMLRGPYRRWYHRHVFRPVDGGVEINDRVEYELPFGPIGRLAHAVAVRRQLQAIFDYRRRKVEEIFGAAPPQPNTPAKLLLFAHGSADPRWQASIESVHSMLKEHWPDRILGVAYLERSSPSLHEAVTDAYARGVRRISVLPLFLTAGKHLRVDGPAIAERLRLT